MNFEFCVFKVLQCRRYPSCPGTLGDTIHCRYRSIGLHQLNIHYELTGTYRRTNGRRAGQRATGRLDSLIKACMSTPNVDKESRVSCDCHMITRHLRRVWNCKKKIEDENIALRLMDCLHISN